MSLAGSVPAGRHPAGRIALLPARSRAFESPRYRKSDSVGIVDLHPLVLAPIGLTFIDLSHTITVSGVTRCMTGAPLSMFLLDLTSIRRRK